MVFEEKLSDRACVECFISDEETDGKPGIICLDFLVQSIELLGIMDVCRGDGKCNGKFLSLVDHRMEFIAVDILLFDVVPASCCLRAIQVCWDDTAVFNNTGDTEKSFGD